MLRSRLFVAAGVLVAGQFLSPLRAQDTRPPTDAGDKMIHADRLSHTDENRVRALRNGTQNITEADKRILEKAAQWYIYRLTWPPYQERKPAEGGTLENARSVYDLLHEETGLYPLIIIPGNNKPLTDKEIAYNQAFTRALVPPIQRVLKNPMPIARVNAGLVLERLSHTGQEELADTLVAVLQDPEQLDAVKLYALMGLKNLLKSGPFVDKSREQKVVVALLEFLKRAPQTQGERPEGVQAFRYIRREAVRAVGQSRIPVRKEKREVVADPAYELLRVLTKSGVSPEPLLAEQVEAAIALCQLQPNLERDYQVDYVARQLGEFLVNYADQYEKERNAASTVPWRYESNRLMDALATLKANTSDSYTIALVDKATPVCRNIQRGDASGVRDLRDWIVRSAPKTSLYKSRQVTVGKPAGEATP
jgi:hypothetical protein